MMHLKYLIFVVSTIMCTSSEMLDIEEMYLNFFVQMESIKKSVDMLKVRLDILSEIDSNRNHDVIGNQFSQVLENFDDVKKSLNVIKSQLDVNSDNGKSKLEEFDGNIQQLEMQQENCMQEIAEVKKNYTNLLDELNKVKKLEESLMQKNSDIEAQYLEILKKFESTSKTNDELNEAKNDIKNVVSKLVNQVSAMENYEKKPLFDVRIDSLPEYKKDCYQDPLPVNCKMATKCTQKSGYYRISLPGNLGQQVMAFCDTQLHDGDWLHILRRKDGSEMFNRPWNDYVNGFGKVEGEYWIGLENLHALTTKNGRTQLYIYIENFEGATFSALYDDFVVGSANEFYELKSLGRYYGPGEDDMSYNVGLKFSTMDRDYDNWKDGSCATERQTGWWYNYCSFVQPTGQYLRGESSRNAIFWRSFGGLTYSHKTMYLMIRN